MTDLLPGPAQAAAFGLAVLVLNATPGPDMLLTLSRSVQGGPRAGLATVAGVNAGCVLHTLAAAFGLAALLALVPWAFALLQVLGAAYLAWLGWGLLRQALRPVAAPAPGAAAPPALGPGGAAGAASSRYGADFRAGLLTNVFNPKVALFFLAFLPPFVPAHSPHRTVSFLLLGAWFVLQNLALMSALALLAAQVRRWQTPAFVQRMAAGLGGALFLGLAWRLLAPRGQAA